MFNMKKGIGGTSNAVLILHGGRATELLVLIPIHGCDDLVVNFARTYCERLVNFIQKFNHT